MGEAVRFVGAEGGAEEPDAEEALLFEEGEEVGWGGAAGSGDWERDEDGFVRPCAEGGVGDGGRGVWADGLVAGRAGSGGDAGPEEFEVVVYFRHGAHGGAGGADGVGLLDGDGWGDAADLVDQRFVHAFEELAGVGGEGFDVAALAFCVDGLEGEGGFAAAAGAGDDVEFTEGEVDVEALEVVLAGTADGDAVRRWWGRRLGGGSGFLSGGPCGHEKRTKVGPDLDAGQGE